MRPIFTTAICTACAVLALSVFARGQEAHTVKVHDSFRSVEKGDYKPLTYFDSFTLGTSYYTNPQRASEINVAYTFEGGEFSNDLKNKAIWDLAQSGRVAFGIFNSSTKSMKVIDFNDFAYQYKIKEPSALPQVLAKAEVKVVATEKNLLGELASATVVKTERANK